MKELKCIMKELKCIMKELKYKKNSKFEIEFVNLDEFIEKQILTLFNSIMTNFYDKKSTRIKKYVILEPYMWIIYNVIQSGKAKLQLEEIVGKDRHNEQCTHQILKYDENISNIIVICDLLLKYVRLSWEKCELQNEVYDNIKNNIHKIIGYAGNEYYIENNAIYKI